MSQRVPQHGEAPDGGVQLVARGGEHLAVDGEPALPGLTRGMISSSVTARNVPPSAGPDSRPTFIVYEVELAGPEVDI